MFYVAQCNRVNLASASVCWRLSTLGGVKWMVDLPLIDEILSSLNKCKTNKDLKATRQLQLSLCDIGLDTHDVLANHLIPTFIECESLFDAHDVFIKSLYPNEVSWTSLLQGYVDHGEAKHSFNLYNRMRENSVFPSKYTFLVMLKACVQLGCIERGRDMHCDIVKNGLDDNCFIGNTLVDMYAKCGSLIDSERVFDELPVQDLVSWNVLITGYSDNGFSEKALACLEQVQGRGLTPDVTTFLSILKACSSMSDLEHCKEIHAVILREEFERDPFLGNSLVDMYAKSGLLEEAWDVFEELRERDIVSWNALMTGHVDHEQYDQVFLCWQEIEYTGISPNTGTFVRVLQACGALGSLERGQGLHTEIIKRGCDNEFYVGNTLIDMYSKCGSVEDSEDVFNRVLVRDVASWNALIAGFSLHGFEDEALKKFRKVQSEGASPDPMTFSMLLKACGNLRALDKGRELHAEALKMGYQDVYAGSTLVDLYAKCGALQDSQDVFEKLACRDIVCWNALVSGYADNGLSKQALFFADQMQFEGLYPDPITFVCSLQACSGMGAFSKAQELHSQIAKAGLEGVPCVNSALINMYGKVAFLAEAQEVFNEQVFHDVYSWTALIAAYAEEGHGEEVSKCVEVMESKGVSPNAVTYVLALKACEMGSLEEIQRLHAVIVEKGFEDDLNICGSLIGMYAQCCKLLEACEVFEKVPVRDLIVWTALIGGYAEQGKCKEALEWLEQMQQHGLTPDCLTYVCALQACCDMKEADMGQTLYSQVVKKGMDQDLCIGNALVDFHAKCGMLAESWEVFHTLPFRDVVSWTSLVGGYVEHGHLEKALECFQAMQLDGIVPDVVAWNTLILAYAERSKCEKVYELYAQMQEQGLSPNSIIFLSILNGCMCALAMDVGKRIHVQALRVSKPDDNRLALETTLVDMYGKCGSIFDAVEVFMSMSMRDLVAWNALLAGYALQGDSETLFSLFEMMIGRSVQPDGDTFRSLLIVCSHAGLLVESQTYWKAMTESFGITKTIKHLTCIIDLFARVGNLEAAGLILESMPFQPDLVPLHVMLSACRKGGDVELGEQLFEFTKDLDGRHCAASILMYNIYVDSLKESFDSHSDFL